MLYIAKIVSAYKWAVSPIFDNFYWQVGEPPLI